jgi:hypothetical protein
MFSDGPASRKEGVSVKIYDSDIRDLLPKKLLSMKTFSEDPSTVWVNELDVCYGMAIMDVAVINGKIHGFEIKSPQDNLARLPAQADYYNRVFDTVTLVVSDKHCDQAMSMIPDWWGVYCVTSGHRAAIRTIRRPRRNRCVDYASLATLLWKEELLNLLGQHGVVRGVKSKTRRQLATLVERQIPAEHISSFVRDTLKTRRDWKARQLRQLCDG